MGEGTGGKILIGEWVEQMTNVIGLPPILGKLVGQTISEGSLPKLNRKQLSELAGIRTQKLECCYKARYWLRPRSRSGEVGVFAGCNS